MGSIVIALIVGYLFSLSIGLIDFSDLGILPLINVPIPFKYGLKFDWIAFIPVAIVYIATMLECIGDITATCMVTGEAISGGTYFRRIKAGVLGDGVNSFLASILSTFPVTTMSQNNGLIKLTGVGSRYVGYYLAGILAILGLFPIVGGFLQKTPAPVLGGATILMFGSIAVAGFNILRTVDMDARASVITAVSLSAALGVTFVPEFLSQLPSLIKQVFESGISTGAIVALLLNIILPGRPQPVDLATEAAELAKEELEELI
jgi:xanthine permease XanP